MRNTMKQVVPIDAKKRKLMQDTQISGVPTLSLASLAVAPLVHEALEFLAILGVAEIF